MTNQATYQLQDLAACDACCSRKATTSTPIPRHQVGFRGRGEHGSRPIELSAEQIKQIQRLIDLSPAPGERHDEVNISTIDR
jgi:hypothetical protein